LATATLTFIGAGNMAASILGGLLASGYPATSLRAADPLPASHERLRQLGNLALYSDNAEACTGSDVVVLAVKPQIMDQAMAEIREAVASTGALVISIAAGTTLGTIQAALGEQTPVVRCMPNTPALVGAGATALYASPQVSRAQRKLAETVLGAVGITRWVPRETDLDAATALSGSGPAYFFLFTEAMINAACDMGLDRETATALAQQTALGAARMALEGDADLMELRRRVTSPGGTTERAVECFEHEGLRELVNHAMDAARQRAEEMGAS
tara:strand:+ start:4189 stop:5004 length:816 start_codon:yes stop_codon:yes gene_type:complete